MKMIVDHRDKQPPRARIRRSERRKAAMAQSIMGTIQELSAERESILAREGGHRTEAGDRGRVERIDHDLRVLWDLRRRELAGEAVSLSEDYCDRYVVLVEGSAPGVGHEVHHAPVGVADHDPGDARFLRAGVGMAPLSLYAVHRASPNLWSC